MSEASEGARPFVLTRPDPPRYVAFAFSIGGLWLLVLLASLAFALFVFDAIHAHSIDAWRYQRQALALGQLSERLTAVLPAGAEENTDQARLLQPMLDEFLNADGSVRAVEVYDGNLRVSAGTDRGARGESMPLAWRVAALQGRPWQVEDPAQGEYAVGLPLKKRSGEFVGHLVVSAAKASRVNPSQLPGTRGWVLAGLAAAAAVVLLMLLVGRYARLVSYEEWLVDVDGSVQPDPSQTDALSQARDVVVRTGNRLRAALKLLGADSEP
jgi:hypothetical protein